MLHISNKPLLLPFYASHPETVVGVICSHRGLFTNTQCSLFDCFICCHCCLCVFTSYSSHLCSLIVFQFNHSLFLGLVSSLVLSFHPPPRLQGLVFCSCHGSFHVSLAGRNWRLNTQEERTKQTGKQQPENRCRAEILQIPPTAS